MLLLNKNFEVSAGTGTQQVPCSLHELSTPVVTTFTPSLDSLLSDGEVPSPSNIYDSSQFMDPSEYSMLNSGEEQFLPLDFPAKLKEDCVSSSAVSLLESVANTVALQVKKEVIDDCFYNSEYTAAFTNIRIKLEDLEGYSDNNLDHVKDLVMEHLIKDVRDTSQALGISSDPRAWNNDDVQKWILLVLRQYNLPMVNLDYFTMNGAVLCTLTEMDFRQRDINAGDIIYTQLELWKTTSGVYRQDSSPVFQPEDSLLDISNYLQLPQTQAVPVSQEGSRRSDVSDALSQAFHSDYSSDGGGFQSDDDLSEDGLESNERNMNVVDGNSGVVATRQGSHSHIHLWQFLKELLMQTQQYGSCIRWLDRSKGIFKIEDSVRVARLWGKRKNRPAMNYDKLSRSIRQYYKKGIMKKTERSQRLVYQFCHPYGQ